MAFDPQEHLMKVRGGQLYLEVKWRLIWLREAHPEASVEVELTHLDLEGKMAVARATVTLPNGTKATEIGSETEKDFPAGWVEKAATKAVGRALAALGFGTQFALELDEGDGERPADSPAAPPQGSAQPRNSTPAKAAPAGATRTAGATVTAPVPQPSHAEQVTAMRTEVHSLLAADTEAAGKLPKGADAMTEEELAKTCVWLRARASRARATPARAALDTELGPDEPAPDPRAAARNAKRHTPNADGEEWPRSAADWTRAQLRQRIQEGAGHKLEKGADWNALAHSYGQPEVASYAEMTQAWLLGLYQAMRAGDYAEMVAMATTEEQVTDLLSEALGERDRRQITSAAYSALCQGAEARKAELSAPLLSGAQGRAQVAS